MYTKKPSPPRQGIKNFGSENRRAAREKKLRKQRRNICLAAAVIIIAVILIVFQVFFGKNAYNVVVGQTAVCTIDKSKHTAVASLSKDLNTNVRFKDKISLEPVHAPASKKVTVEYAVTKVKESAAYEVEAGIIIVDNKRTVVLKTKNEADNLLESIKGKFAPENADVTKCTFEQSVSTVTDFVDSAEILTFEEAYKKLTFTEPREETYTVAKGDAVWTVANRFGMTINELKELNSMSDDNLFIGQELKIVRQVPFLTVEYNG